MRIQYDGQVDALSIIFREAQAVTHELGEGIAIDIDADGNLVAIEVLDAAKRLGSIESLENVSMKTVNV
jgi:uncharacterized protein YuzE